MDEQDRAAERRRTQATQWFARLKTVPVSKGTLDDFFKWRRDPANAAAFEEVEQLWGQSGRIGATPAMLRLTEAAMARGRTRRPWRWPFLSALVVAGAAIVMAVLLVTGWLDGPAPAAYATAIGEQRRLALADGSQVHLNTDSRLDARLGEEERRIRLDRGEALFDVAHDRSRPFIVAAGDVEVRAMGTRFDVRHLGDRTLVLLFEGSVEIRAPGQPVVALRAGQRWQSPGSSPAPAETGDIRQAIAWTDGRVVFEATPLGAAVAEINRYTNRKLVLAAPGRAGSPISGSFATGDPEGFAKAVAALLALQVEPRADGSVILRESPAA